MSQDVERWKADLAAAGWTAASATAWWDPTGGLYRGPYGAWKELQRRNTPNWNIQATPELLDNWPVCDVLTRLADAATHLLQDHDCDAHGYEGLQHAVVAAREYVRAATIATERAALERTTESGEGGDDG